VLSRYARRALRSQPVPGPTIASLGAVCTAELRVLRPGVVCGLDAAAAVFAAVDPTLSFEPLAWDGARVGPTPATVGLVRGSETSVELARPAAVETIARLSGIATRVDRLVAAVAAYPAEIVGVDTATETLEWYAIQCGGGRTDRSAGPERRVLAPGDLELGSGIGAAVRRATALAPESFAMEAEVATLEEARRAMAAGAGALVLRGMDVEDVERVVAEATPGTWLHAVGGMTLATVERYARTGVDAITPDDLTGGPPLETALVPRAPAQHGG
jgi:nicotinate-nucleotide pyrophosphorylase (carboxylating)